MEVVVDLQGGGNNKVSAFLMGYPRASLYMKRPFQVNLINQAFSC